MTSQKNSHTVQLGPPSWALTSSTSLSPLSLSLSRSSDRPLCAAIKPVELNSTMELLLGPASSGLPHIFFKGAVLTSECHEVLGRRERERERGEKMKVAQREERRNSCSCLKSGRVFAPC